MQKHLYLVNYSHPNCTPLKNIMRLPEEEAFALAARLAAENPDTTAFGRFADFHHYYPRRKETDKQLYEAFVALGGQPAETHPLSFVLEGSEYLDEWFGHGTVTKVPLACIRGEQISFTLGDSMSSLARDGHLTMLTLDMLRTNMTAHPQGAEGYLQDMRAAHHYIEVQLWDDTPCILSEAVRQLSLGELTAPPQVLTGGYTHRMFRVETDRGAYAVKLLNPEIMQRPDALDNYRAAEAGEQLLEAAGLPILPALIIGGQKLQCVGGQYLFVFDYFDGQPLSAEAITPAHCARIGEVLARIHAIDRRDQAEPLSGPMIPWTELAESLLSSPDAQAEGALLHSALPMLEHVTAGAEEAAHRLPPMEALCHNDMDPKNVLWRGEDFRIIDLECVGYANPAQEMLDLAISWSSGEETRFKAFASAYFAAGGAPIPDAASVYDSRRNYIDWLAYNARRARFDDPQERAVARQQIRCTLEKIRDDLRQREQILSWMAAVQAKATLKLAACGLDCNACNLYKASFDTHAAAALVDWFRSRGWIGTDEGAEAIQRQTPLCMGCWTKNGPCWCGDCQFRSCCEVNGYSDCSECAGFPCAAYREWTVGQAHHQHAMEFLMARKRS